MASPQAISIVVFPRRQTWRCSVAESQLRRIVLELRAQRREIDRAVAALEAVINGTNGRCEGRQRVRKLNKHHRAKKEMEPPGKWFHSFVASNERQLGSFLSLCLPCRPARPLGVGDSLSRSSGHRAARLGRSGDLRSRFDRCIGPSERTDGCIKTGKFRLNTIAFGFQFLDYLRQTAHGCIPPRALILSGARPGRL